MKAYRLLIVPVISAVVSSCQTDRIEIPASELYAREFIKEFGIVDPDQDWNLSTKIIAHTDAAALGGATKIYVYDRMPGTDDCQLAAKFSVSSSDFEFDFMKDRTRAYVCAVTDEGCVAYSSYIPINDGILNIGSSLGSRADVDRPADIKLHRIQEDGSDGLGKGIGYFWYNASNWDVAGAEHSCNYDYWAYHYPDECHEYGDALKELKPILSVFPLYGMHTGTFANDYLRGTYSDEDDGRPCSDLAAIVGSDGVFHEGVKESISNTGLKSKHCNLNLHGSKLNPQDGVIYTSQGGEITLEYIYGAGIYDNSFGYFYYREGASTREILECPKFILMYDASPWNNTRRETADGGYDNFGSLGVDLGDGTISNVGINNFAGMNPSIDMDNYEKNISDVRYKPSYHKLVYYELDSNNEPIESSASYNFPAGVKVGFFLITQGHQKMRFNGAADIDNPENGGSKDVVGEDFRFSIPWMNQLLGAYYQSQGDHGYTPFAKMPLQYEGGQIDDYTPHMAFVTYNWNGETVMGVEDGQYHKNDHDMNDILFFVRGVDTPDEGFDTDVRAQSWIIACEDLGSSGDFDFNDVVFGVSHIATDEEHQEVYVKALAAGGTLPVNLFYNGNKVGDYSTWNQWFSSESKRVADEDIINVGRLGHHNGLDGAEIKLEIQGSFSLSSGMFNAGASTPMGGFALQIEGANGHSYWVRPPGTTGDDAVAPQMILVPSTWSWPTEHTNICDAYYGVGDNHEGFRDWCKNHSLTEWYLFPSDNSQVIKHDWKPQASK